MNFTDKHIYPLLTKTKELKKYNNTRGSAPKDLFCYAPFKNIYFNIHGDAAPCWQSFIHPDSYPEKTVSEIWNGDFFNEIREGIKKNILSEKCFRCYDNFVKGNYMNILARAYDNNYPLNKYPSVLELELGNSCNLECIMCKGELSSAIAINREKRPNSKSPYDDKFVEQLSEFFPYVSEVRINGGEPFLNPINFTICEKLLSVNRNVNIVIATNGNVLNEKIISLLEKGRFSINISIDSLQQDNYEKIRINGDFKVLMKNFHFYYEYCKRKKTSLCVLTNPMPQNWWEMPDFIKFSNRLNIPIWFNTVQTPVSCALWALNYDELKSIFFELSKHKFSKNPFKKNTLHNKKTYENLVYNQIYNWMKEAESRKNVEISDNIFSIEKLLDDYVDFLKIKETDIEAVNAECEKIRRKISQVMDIVQEERLDIRKIAEVYNTLPKEIFFKEFISMDVDEIIQQVKQISKTS